MHPRAAPPADAPRDRCIDGETIEVRLRNISSMGALVECDASVAPGAELTIDIVGVGPVRGARPLGAVRQVRRPVRASSSTSRRLAPKQEKRGEP